VSRSQIHAGRALAAILAVASAVTAAAQEPVFVRKLVLPVAQDAIGYPHGVTADPHTGEVFVCDSRTSRILIFDADGLFLYEIPGGDRFAAPQDITVDPEGLLVVVASHDRRRAVVELDFDGLFLREVELQNLPESVEAPRISSLALSPTGETLYLLDSVNLRVWMARRSGEITGSIDLAAGLSEREAEELILGHIDVYGDTLLLAVPSFSQVRMFTLDGKPSKVVGRPGTASCTLAFPTAAALSREGELVVVDQQRMLVMRWNPETNLCLGEYIGLGAAPGYLYYPIDLALDRAGHLFVGQGFDGRVQMYEGLLPAPGPPAGNP